MMDEGNALVFPHSHYTLKLMPQKPSAPILKQMATHIEKCSFLCQETFKTSLKEGLSIDSLIPMQKGLGSSGALCAAIYHHCGDKKITESLLLKNLATLESFFHGQSSGIDPLCSYLQRPLWLQKNNITPLDRFSIPKFQMAFCHSSWNTKKMIAGYQEFKRQKKALVLEWNTLNQQLITLYLQNKFDLFYSSVTKLSGLQKKFLQFCNHEEMLSLWREKEGEGQLPKFLGSGANSLLLLNAEDYQIRTRS